MAEMKNYIFSFLCILIFSACNNNKLVGTWETNSSDNIYESAYVGTVTTENYKSNGEYVSILELQASYENRNYNDACTIKGTWKMIDDTHVQLNIKTATVSGKEMPNITERTFTIISINDNEMVTMKGGKKQTYVRKE